MNRHGFSITVCTLAAVCCLLGILSCSGTPTAPGGFVLVSVTQDGVRPAPGKTIEIPGTTLRETTDANGMALFSLHAGTWVVRAYDISTPGPSRPYVEQTVEVQPARTSRAQFNECLYCR